MKMYLDGTWVDSQVMSPVVSPYFHEAIDSVPEATPAQVEQALGAADRSAAAMAQLTGYERSQILNRAADLVAARLEDLAKTISLEEGKPLSE